MDNATPGSSCQIVSVGIDYFRGTFTDRFHCRRASERATTLLRAEQDRGCKVRPWGMSGFKGWTTGSVAYGRRDDELLVQLSSHVSHYNWRWFNEIASNVSRLDCEVSVFYGPMARSRVMRHRREAARFASTRRKPFYVGRRSGNDGGETCYINKRTSDAMGRIYDKGAESKQAEWLNVVRYEVEFKRDLAWNVAKTISLGSSDSVEACLRVSGFFREHGVSLPRLMAPGIHSGCTRSRSDVDKTLEWLTKAVRPCLMTTIRVCGIGPVLEALGLDHEDINNQTASCSFNERRKKRVSPQSNHERLVLRSDVSKRRAC